MIRLGSNSQTRAKILKEHNIDFIQNGGNFDENLVYINGFEVLEREGEVLAQDTENKLYEVRDIEKNWILIIPFEDAGEIKEVI